MARDCEHDEGGGMTAFTPLSTPPDDFAGVFEAIGEQSGDPIMKQLCKDLADSINGGALYQKIVEGDEEEERARWLGEGD